MIGYLSGTVLARTEKTLILEVQGIGYEVSTHNAILAEVEVGEICALYIHTHVREDQLQLFGFKDLSEREFFLSVTSVSGIGPRIGMEILSSPLGMVKQAIIEKDVAFLTKIPGIGKKTAERMIVELSGKIDVLEAQQLTGTVPGLNDADIISALENLGYKRDSVLLALRHKPEELTSEEEVIKYCLKIL